MPVSASKAWFKSPSIGAGLSLPTGWQGWAVLGIGLGGALVSMKVFHGTAARDWVPLVALAATWAVIHLKRAP